MTTILLTQEMSRRHEEVRRILKENAGLREHDEVFTGLFERAHANRYTDVVSSNYLLSLNTEAARHTLLTLAAGLLRVNEPVVPVNRTE